MSADSEAAAFVKALSESLAGSGERERLTIAAYDAIPKRARAVARLVYRCRAGGDLLLIAWQSPIGILFYKPRYKLSNGRNLATSNESGRAAHTEDGRNHWRSSAGLLDDMRAWTQSDDDADTFRFDLNCRDVLTSVLGSQIVSDADRGKPGHPTRRTF